uniref:Peptide PGLa-R6 n=1 Tax=Xenopus ruwenzoriensis TaxID=105430 RepID=PGLR6_XENRU|nr:RecName: Full=Peptide PGLa-R6 [Xenopus ruwenzoriensis]
GMASTAGSVLGKLAKTAIGIL